MSGPYRDGRVHVVADKCATCIYRPGNLMFLEPGRVKDLADSARADDTTITCHSTLPDVTGGPGAEAVCRGYYDAHADEVTPLRLAAAMDLLTFDEPRSFHTPRKDTP